MGNVCVVCWQRETRGNNQFICGECRKRRRLHKEREKVNRLWKRLIKFHKYLVEDGYSKELRIRMWKNFKPLLPKDYQKYLTKKGY